MTKTTTTLMMIALLAPIAGCDDGSTDSLRSHEIVGLGSWTEDGRQFTHLRIDGAERLVITPEGDAAGPIVVASVAGMPLAAAKPDADESLAYADLDALMAGESVAWTTTAPEQLDAATVALVELVEDGELELGSFRIGLTSATRPSLKPSLSCVLDWAWHVITAPSDLMVPSLSDWCG